MQVNGRILGMLLLACVVAGCDDDDPPTAPSTPPPATVTETFTGNIAPNGATTHTFSTATGGAVTATLKAIGTDNTLVVSFALGNWTGESCLVILANDRATGGAKLEGTMTGTGKLCARISDVGNLATGQTADYTIEVVHP
jgi:hypothetical protein